MARKRILLDMETQRDLFAPGGSCYRPDASNVAGRIYDLIRWARRRGVPIVSTVLRVRRGQTGPLANVEHCLDGTPGERKLRRTVVPGSINLGLQNITDLPPDILASFPQVIFEKRQTDIFAHARIERLIDEQIRNATVVICGAGIAHGIYQAAIGLRCRSFKVIVPYDAVLSLGHPWEANAVRRMAAKNVIFIPTRRIVPPRHRRRLVALGAGLRRETA